MKKMIIKQNNCYNLKTQMFRKVKPLKEIKNLLYQ